MGMTEAEAPFSGAVGLPAGAWRAVRGLSLSLNRPGIACHFHAQQFLAPSPADEETCKIAISTFPTPLERVRATYISLVGRRIVEVEPVLKYVSKCVE